ncbi:disease resistance protein RPM1-like [Chenopodium quinoa]|uniref:Disease resistance protein RPM1-like n=1 Tax=Chenopodium quinoa TaxID=63459 RepID=A0A803L5T5_CHEQI|nr:disease resistance protein RPM1-like [Chenopodium quinoa]
MTEAVVSLVIQNLVPLLVDEATFLSGIHREVAQIKGELESIQSFVRDADAKAEKDAINYGAKTWVNQLREVAYQIEDVMDNYVLYMATEAQCHDCPRVFGTLGRALCRILRLKPQSQMACEIKHIKDRIHAIKERGKSFGFRSSEPEANRENESWHYPRVTSLFIEEAEVVGIESHRDRLIGWLVNGASKRTVISVYGMGGLGKTTLVRKVYENHLVTNHFNYQAWITVSQSYKVEDLLRKTLKEFYKARKETPPTEIDQMDETLLIIELREYLKQKRYMVVFDDVWTVEFWALIRHTLPDDGQSSRVLITTRSEYVASSCKESSFDEMYKLQPLPEEAALELFCKKVFHSDIESGSPSEFKELSGNLVKKCEGLPLAVVAIAGMLSTKRKAKSELQKLESSLGSELLTNPHLSSMSRILSLSYYDLPYYLKLCLMYFGMLPEDYSIRHARLIRLWIAEGFIKGTRGRTMEQVAEEYLAELINRSLVQVSRIDVDGKIRTIRVHDLMREIILSKSEELSFGNVWTGSSSSFDGLTRRLSIHRCNDDSFLKSNRKFGIRSLSIFDVDNFPSSVLCALTKVFKLLKVLDLDGAPTDFIPEEVGDLFHLRYISLRNTKTKKLPKSIGKLHNLQTLDLKCSFVHELPGEINRLLNLQYLIGYSYEYETDFSISSQRGLKLKQGLGRLQNLQKLYLVEANHGITLFRELRKLKQLRKLGITKLETPNGKMFCESIALMRHLESLEVCSQSEEEILDLKFLSSPPQHLERLYLKGRLERIPDWIPQLKNLVTVSLMWSRMIIDPLSILQNLPTLSELVLQEAFLGEELVFQATGFQKLKILKLYDMNTLMTLTIEVGALPLLRLLKMGPIPRLDTVPTGIHHLKSLTALRFYDVSKDFALKLLPGVGQDFWVVEHIQTVLFHYQLQGECYRTSTLSDLV